MLDERSSSPSVLTTRSTSPALDERRGEEPSMSFIVREDIRQGCGGLGRRSAKERKGHPLYRARLII